MLHVPPASPPARTPAPRLSTPGTARADAPARAAFLLHPPYDRSEYHTNWIALEARHRVHGTIVGIRLDEPHADWTALEPMVRETRRRLPAAPVILLLRGSVGEGLLVSARAARCGVRAVVLEGQPLPEALRVPLTQPASLAEDVVEWLTLRAPRLSPTVTSLLLQIFSLAPECADLASLLARAGTPETSARFRLHKRRMPPPSRWFQTARALHLALRIQAEPETCLLRIAHRFGYADHSALSQLVFRAFGMRPGAIRGTLGWEWLMERWLTAELPAWSRAPFAV